MAENETINRPSDESVTYTNADIDPKTLYPDDSLNYGSCWYYERQMQNPLLSVTLHANQRQVNENGALVWKDWNSDECDKECYVKSGASGNKGCGYRLKPICSSIISDDFTIAVGNNWSDTGNDVLGTIWNTAVKPFSPYTDIAFETINQMRKAQEGRDRSSDSWISRTAEGLVDWISNNVTNDSRRDRVETLMNAQLVTQGSRFAFYMGTGVQFGNLMMKFTIFPKWDVDENGNVFFNSVTRQLTDLYPYFFGTYTSEDITIDLNGDGKGVNLKNFIGWQMAPGGFRANTRSVDTILQGTLKLRIGSQYSISNLVVENCQLNLSKQSVKNPILYGRKNTEGLISPLYCDVILSFRPCTRYTDKALQKFVNGINNSDRRNVVQNMLSDKIIRRREFEDSAYTALQNRAIDSVDQYGDQALELKESQVETSEPIIDDAGGTMTESYGHKWVHSKNGTEDIDISLFDETTVVGKQQIREAFTSMGYEDWQAEDYLNGLWQPE